MILLVPVRVRASMAHSAARSVLNYFKITSPGVPAKFLLKQYGRLFYFSGFCEESRNDFGFCKYNGYEYQIYINKDLTGGVDNFAYGHELGHIVLGHFTDFDANNLSDRQLWFLNREADIFATNLLMPESLIYKYVELPFLSVREIGQYKNLFGISWEAFINRLDELHLCTKRNIERLFETERKEKIERYKSAREWLESFNQTACK